MAESIVGARSQDETAIVTPFYFGNPPPFTYLSHMKRKCSISGLLMSALLLSSCLRSYTEQDIKVGNTIVEIIEEYIQENNIEIMSMKIIILKLK